MYNPLQLAGKYISYFLTASNKKGHGTHSPFIFDFIRKVLSDDTVFSEYTRVENLRQQLLKDNSVLEVEDLGAGSTVSKNNKRSIASIARHAAKPKKYGQLLFRMARYYKPATILELGTSLGISTAYFSLANPLAKIYTMEGSGEIAKKARENFNILDLQNIRIIEGNFDETLNPLIKEMPEIDLAFIDGNHRKEPTEKYFSQLLMNKNSNSVFIFDDIHWSDEMEAAWQHIKDHRAVTCSVDLFFIGIIFFRKDFKEKQHFTIRF